MRLFNIGEDMRIQLNKEWMLLIPEFKALIHRDKGSAGDADGRKKLKAIREFTFIYFDLDFTSPLSSWDEFERRQEALLYAGLTEADLDPLLLAAHARYDSLLQKSTRSLRTLRMVEKSLTALDEYYESINFKEKDKKGELLHDPNAYMTGLEKLEKAYSAVEKFRKRVAEELKGDMSIRGTATLGTKEGKRTKWEEASSSSATDRFEETLQGPSPQGKTTSFKELAVLLHTGDEDDFDHQVAEEKEEELEEEDTL